MVEATSVSATIASAFEVVPTRVLIIDDTPAIHADIRKILAPTEIDDDLEQLKAELFNEQRRVDTSVEVSFRVDSAFQGNTGLSMVANSIKNREPYSMAFVDVRMPPGWDGIETIQRIREVDDKIQIVLCTAYSDYSWGDLRERFGRNDWMLIVKKPFDVVEVQNLACTLSQRWGQSRRDSFDRRQLNRTVLDRTSQLSLAHKRVKTANLHLQAAHDKLHVEIKARHDADQRLKHMAHHDELTGLPNRSRLSHRLDACRARAKFDVDYQFAIVFIDLDNFKMVNDSLGYAAGDDVLKEVAQRLEEVAHSGGRDKTSTLDMVARVGGDEFVVLLDDIDDKRGLMQFADEVGNALAHSIRLGDDEFKPTAGIGITVYQGGDTSSFDPLRDADIALDQAKEKGKSGVALFDRRMLDALQERLEVETDLRHAVEREEFVVHYQPLVDMQTTEVVSFEALVRWNHPTKGLLFPDKFISVAEETGVIGDIGRIVLREVCRFARSLSRSHPQHDAIRFAVNVARQQFASHQLVDQVRQALQEFDLAGDKLMLEITETTMMKNVANVQEQCDQLAAMGVEIVLDDFGIGYSSLSMLHMLAFASIKIDRSFVSDIIESPDEFVPTIQAMALLAEHRGFELVAEGIETKEQYELLRELNCSVGQGYYFGRPMSGERCSELLRESLMLTAANA